MSNRRKITFVFSVILAALFATAGVLALPGATQNSSTQLVSKPLTKDIPAPSPAAPAATEHGSAPPARATGAAIFASAATRNAALRYDLDWAFGGKQQRGWHLYVPLIGRLLDTDVEAQTTDFAAAMADWQQNVGLEPTGILDSDTWYMMVSVWQSRRSNDRTYPRPDQVLTAPPTDFYHPTRPAELRQVEVETYAAYKRMVAAAAADPSLRLAPGSDGGLAPEEKYLKIISAFRSREYQDQLRRQAPGVGRAGLAVNSPHFTGRALDIYVGGEPVDTSDYNRALQVRTPVYQWLVRNAERFGFYPYYYEPWHWEYRGN